MLAVPAVGEEGTVGGEGEEEAVATKGGGELKGGRTLWWLLIGWVFDFRQGRCSFMRACVVARVAAVYAILVHGPPCRNSALFGRCMCVDIRRATGAGTESALLFRHSSGLASLALYDSALLREKL